ncbi:universal stress protein [Streptosporangium sp. NPDC051022]|uniref:universal stress protein n=1 Tax=Streptosporangium sp. NPDC051022 TaxID=3155752 RepID=UPI00344A0FFE
MTESIAVGTDGSAAAATALRWAVDDAARRGLSLRIVHVVDHWPHDLLGFPAPERAAHLRRLGETMLAEAAASAAEQEPEIRLSTELIEGAPPEVLREQAETAVELVVGHRGMGGFAGALLGSVPLRVAGHARGAVVVVRSSAAGPYGEVVVGVDGSAVCEPALGFAFEQACLRGCPLHAVYAWRSSPGTVPESHLDLEGVRRERRGVAAGQLASWRERFPGVGVAEDVVCASPVPALVAASARADLLVVGSRGLDTVGCLILGSVSRGLLHHARCPVAVVR